MPDAAQKDVDAGDVVQFVYDPSNDNIAEHTEPCLCLVLGAFPANEQTFVLLAPGTLVDPVLPRPADVFFLDSDNFVKLGNTPGILFDCTDRILVSTAHSRFVRQTDGGLVVCKLNSSQRSKIENFVMLESIFVELSAEQQSKRIFEGK